MRILVLVLMLRFYSLCGFAQATGKSFCSLRSSNQIGDLTISEKNKRRQARAMELFSAPTGEGYVSPERLEKGFAELEEYRLYCAERCNAYETLYMYIGFAQVYFDQQRIGDMFNAYQQAINTGVRIPTGFETDILRNTANVYFDRGEFHLLAPCLDRLSEIGTYSIINDGHLTSASQFASGRYDKALEFISNVRSLFILSLSKVLICHLFHRGIYLSGQLRLCINVCFSPGNIILGTYTFAGSAEEAVI